MKIVAVVQARMGSTRLPGKVLRELDGQPTLDWVVTAAHHSPVSQVVVATSTNPENDAIEKFCAKIGTVCIRGSEDDVLSRYIKVLDETEADAVVRLTADCPFHDPHVIGDVIELYKANGAHYACTTEPPTWPDGMDVEVVSAYALRIANEKATRQTDRDTVTRYIVRNRHEFGCVNLTCPINLSGERWVLDSPEDYDFCRALVAAMGGRPVSWHHIYETLNKFPHIRKINAKYSRNERFFADLGHEKVTRKFGKSTRQLELARDVIPLGTQTFSKSYLQYGSDGPLFCSHGDGAYLYDIDGNDYVDLVGALLPVVLGYRDPDVDYAVRRQLDSGITHSLTTELEWKLAEKLIELIPCAEKVRFFKNGSDVTTAAVRLARAFTGRNIILTQGYHGWHEWTVEGTNRSRGIAHTGTVLHGEVGNLKANHCAAVIIEPEYWKSAQLRELKEECQRHDALLIFDEVISGFRWSLGGYGKYVGVKPDLACFGKAMANGMPLSAVVGRSDVMALFEPPDNIFASGTFFGEGLSLAAALATIKKLEEKNVIRHFWDMGTLLANDVNLLLSQNDMWKAITLYGDAPVKRLAFHSVGDVSSERIKALFMREMANAGVLIIGSHNLSYAHQEPQIKKILIAYREALGRIAGHIKAGTVPMAENLISLRKADE